MANHNYSMLVFDGVPVNGTNEVQSIAISGSPTGGTFTLTYDGQTTGAIAYNASAAAVQAALEAISNIDSGDVACSGGPLPGTAVTVTFQNKLGGKNVSLLTANSSGLTGGSTPTVTPSTTTAGVRGTYRTAQNGAILAAKDGDGNGVLYENTGNRGTPTWSQIEVE